MGADGEHLEERCALGEPDALEEVQDLYASWRDWCAVTGEYTGSIKRFSRALDARKFARVSHPVSRRAAFRGIRLLVKATTMGSGGQDAVTF